MQAMAQDTHFRAFGEVDCRVCNESALVRVVGSEFFWGVRAGADLGMVLQHFQ